MKKAGSVDAYLAALPQNARTTLEKVRAAIRSAAPTADEKIAYGMPGFYYAGRPLVYYAAFKNHCSLFPASVAVMDMFRDDLERYETEKGTIRFPIGKPPPVTLVTKIVKARLAETDARSKR